MSAHARATRLLTRNRAAIVHTLGEESRKAPEFVRTNYALRPITKIEDYYEGERMSFMGNLS